MGELNNLESIIYKINQALSSAHLPQLAPKTAGRFETYLALIVRWNARTNLTAVRAVDAIIERHFVECIACAAALPQGITRLLDYGSGAGFPGIPVALCRPEIEATLAESQGKKAAFLREALRALGLAGEVYAGRAEEIGSQFDCVTLRAVDRMQVAVGAAARLVRVGGWLALMTTAADLVKVEAAGGSEFVWREPIPLPGSEERVLALGLKVDAAA